MTTMRAPHMMGKLRFPIEIDLKCNSRVRKWAHDNAYMLIVMGVLFAITWGYLLYEGVKNSVN